MRNLTTRRLHTKMDDIYQDIEYLTGSEGIFTHMLPNAARALEPWLQEKGLDPRFWDEQYDTTHTGEYAITPMDADEKKAFFERFMALPHPFG